MSPLTNFIKPWRSYSDQVTLLEERGLVVDDPVAARDCLSHLNYYRFSGYCLAFEANRHVFIAGTTFEQVYAAYNFDLHLRDLITEALEVVEVDFRGAVAHNFSEHLGPFCHIDKDNFIKGFDHAEFLEQLQEEATRSKELFVTHFKDSYLEFPNLPVWVATEIASFGCLSKMFGGMRAAPQGNIAQRYGWQPAVLASCIHHLSYIRNLCAHHSRFWDRYWAIKPTLPHGNNWQPPNHVDNGRLFVSLLILRSMLKKIPAVADFRAQWKARVQEHLDAPPSAPNALDKMGLPANWHGHPVWA